MGNRGHFSTTKDVMLLPELLLIMRRKVQQASKEDIVFIMIPQYNFKVYHIFPTKDKMVELTSIRYTARHIHLSNNACAMHIHQLRKRSSGNVDHVQ